MRQEGHGLTLRQVAPGRYRALSAATRGSFEPKAEEIFPDLGDGGAVATPLWPWLVAAALLLFMLDVLVRRTPWLALLRGPARSPGRG